MRVKLTVLEDVRIASPCSASWDAMKGDDRVRFCGACEKNVYNLSGMTRPEAMQFLRTHEGHLCLRFYQRADGTILTQDCPVGLQAVKRRLAWLAACVATGVLMVWNHFRGAEFPRLPESGLRTWSGHADLDRVKHWERDSVCPVMEPEVQNRDAEKERLRTAPPEDGKVMMGGAPAFHIQEGAE